ncbi:MAG: hypothetical protein ABSB78_11215 [Bacteroidota bacterium]
MKIKYFNNGQSGIVELNKDNSKKVFDELKNLIEGINDMARLVVDEERIDELRKNDEALEIEFDNEIEFNSKEFEQLKIKKILLPLSGDLAYTEDESAAVIFLGSTAYEPNPYLNLNGRSHISNLMKILPGIKKK